MTIENGNSNNDNLYRSHQQPQSPQSQFQTHLSPDFFDPKLYYTTQDTATTAWLMTCGFSIESVSTKGIDYIFVFKKSIELETAVTKWEFKSAIGNCGLYEDNRRTLIKIVKRNANK